MREKKSHITFKRGAESLYVLLMSSTIIACVSAEITKVQTPESHPSHHDQMQRH